MPAHFLLKRHLTMAALSRTLPLPCSGSCPFVEGYWTRTMGLFAFQRCRDAVWWSQGKATNSALNPVPCIASSHEAAMS